jgi:hypothetical protein
LNRLLKTLAALAAVGVAAGAAFLVVGRRQIRTRGVREIQALLAGAGDAITAQELATRSSALPTPIRWHLMFALPDDVPAVSTFRMTQSGQFFASGRWFAIEAEEYFTAGKPGFIWNASMRAAPLFEIDVSDHLLNGRGKMFVTIDSTFAIVDSPPSPEIDQSAQLRWLMELVWFPPAFVAEGIRWEAIDARSARASIAEARLPGSAVFEIDDDGKIVTVRADRYRNLGGNKNVLTPCIARCNDYQEFAGFRIPARVEISWALPEGELVWARLRPTSLELLTPVSGGEQA